MSFTNLKVSTKFNILIILIISGFILTTTLVIHHQVTQEFNQQRTAILAYQKADIAEKTRLVHQLATKVFEEESKIENIEKQYQGKLGAVIDAILSMLEARYYRLKAEGVTEDLIQDRLKHSLRQVRYDNGAGYLFVLDFDGNVVAHADPKEFEGKNLFNQPDVKGKYFIREMIDLVKRQGQGVVNYSWTKLGYQEPQLKVSYVKLFKPYYWIIGTGIYVEDVKAVLQQKIADLITSYRYDIGETKNNYFFILDSAGVTIRNAGFPHLNGVDVSQIKDNNGKLFVQKFLKVVKESGHGFVQYTWPKLRNDHQVGTKISYVKRFEPFNWVIATGVYLDEIGIKEAEQQLKQTADRQVRTMMTTGLVFFGLGVVVSFLFVHLMTKPLLRAKQVAEEIASGNFATQVQYYAGDEVGLLVCSLNRMSQKLQALFAKLDIQNQELEELNRLKDVFLTELEQKRQELQDKNGHLMKLNQEKNEFLGMAAHDLKNPLQAVQGAAELIEKTFDDFAKEEIIEFACMIGLSSQRMFRLINDLLDVNAIESGNLKVSLKWANVLPILQGIIKDYKERAQMKEITLHFTPVAEEYCAWIDRNTVCQVLDNLISNAVKYSPPGRNVFVCISHTDHAVRCEIQDEGPGLSEADQQKLFGKFTRLTAQPTGGEHTTGLGLFIVKKLVEAMKGKVWCESELGKGAIFIVEFGKIGDGTD